MLYYIHMYLIVGLGNPGKEYEGSRHNVGFLLLDMLEKEHNFPAFTLSKKHTSLVSEGILNKTKTILAKPQTFMNASGKAVKSLMQTKSNLIVVHDDIDIPLGKIKISENRGSAGHKGIDSIIQTLGTKNFTRVRIGIQPAKGKPNAVDEFVLKSFTSTEAKSLTSSVTTAIQHILELVK